MDASKIIDAHLQSQRGSATELLQSLISYETTPGQESGIQQFLLEHLENLGLRATAVPIEADIETDPDYSPVPSHKGYDGRFNVLVDVPAIGGGRSLVLNAHTDVVPAPNKLYSATVSEGTIHGRGACDDKGPAVSIILALTALRELGLNLQGNLQAQFVIEEEAGGNGTLSLIKQGYTADAAVVAEPTDLNLFAANRGVLWFKLSVKGRSTHLGTYYRGVSAIEEMVGLMDVLRSYSQRLQEESRDDPLFPYDPTPATVNFGQIGGGDWPGTVPEDCWIEGAVCMLPNKSIDMIKNELREVIELNASDWAKSHYTLEFIRVKNEPYAMDVSHPLVTLMAKTADEVRGLRPVLGAPYSCDARLLYIRAGMPTVVFGPGQNVHAHALDEQIRVSDILIAAKTMALFALDWCGVQNLKEEQSEE